MSPAHVGDLALPTIYPVRLLVQNWSNFPGCISLPHFVAPIMSEFQFFYHS
jgi:hypothetical protein